MTTRNPDPEPAPHPLAEIRATRGWSYQRLARIIASRARSHGINMAAERQKIWRWEHKGVTPDRLSQRLLAEELGLDPDILAIHPWPDWLPSSRQAPCIRRITELKVQLAVTRAQVTELAQPAKQHRDVRP